MEKLKKYLWERIVEEIENSKDEKVKNYIKAFDSKEDLIKFIKFYSNLGFDDMKRVSSLGYFIRKTKYHYAHERLLGNKTKAMPEEIYQKLIDYVSKNIGIKEKLALEFEGIEGPRGEDVVRIKLDDFDFDKHIVKILNRKRKRWYEIPLNKDLESEIKDFINSNEDNIKNHENYLFFSLNPVQKRNHISQKYLKTLVYNVLKKLGLNKVYSKSYDGRNLNLYTLHSLRGHAGTRVYEKTGHDLEKVQELLDHEPGSADVTMLYVERDSEKDLEGVI